MAGYKCGSCHADGPLFQGDAGERLARDAAAPLLARIPFDPAMQSLVDQGDVASAARALGPAAQALAERLGPFDGDEEPRA